MTTSADLILFNGRVRTLDPQNPEASALAIADGRLLSVGSDAEALDLRGPGSEVIDLGGAAVTPGIIDSHIHPFLSSIFKGGLDLMGARSLDEVRAAVSAAAKSAR